MSPQSMKNVQQFIVYVWETLKPVAKDCYIVHYMDMAFNSTS